MRMMKKMERMEDEYRMDDIRNMVEPREKNKNMEEKWKRKKKKRRRKKKRAEEGWKKQSRSRR
jgi:hypothetical protein